MPIGSGGAVSCHCSRRPGVRVPLAPSCGLGVPRAPGCGCIAALTVRAFVPDVAYGHGLWWLIRASWLIGGTPVHRIRRRARIRRANRRAPPPGVAPAVSCGGCDVRGGGGAIIRSPWPRWSAGGLAGWWQSCRAPLHRVGLRIPRGPRRITAPQGSLPCLTRARHPPRRPYQPRRPPQPRPGQPQPAALTTSMLH